MKSERLSHCLNRQRIGEGMNNLDDLSFQQLRTLEDDMVSSTEKIRERKVHSDEI